MKAKLGSFYIFHLPFFICHLAWHRLLSFLVAASCVLLVLPSAGAWQVQPGTGAVDAHVIMISIDGFPPDYYTRSAVLGLKLPNITSLKLAGAYAEGVEGVYPSVTYPAHTTMVTGVRPALHGVVHNRIFEAPTEPQTRAWYWFAGALKSETLWGLAKKAGLVTASVGWPVTVGADLDYLMPEIWDPMELPPTMKRAREYSTPGLLDDAIKTSDRPGVKEMRGDEFRTVVAEHIINAYRPNLMVIHLIELDDAHHKNGAGSAAGLKVAEREDAFVGRIIEATRKADILEKTTFLIVSDHGFARVEKRFNPSVILVKEGLITLDAKGNPTSWKAAAWPAGGSCAIVLRDASDKETAAKVKAIFSKLASGDDRPISRVIDRDELDRVRAAPGALLMLEAAPGYTIGDAYTGEAVGPSGQSYQGTHGYHPSRAEMRSALIISGRGARPGAKVAIARMIDIAPTAAGLLGLTFPRAEGSPIRELLKPGFAPPTPPRERQQRKSGP